MVFLKARIVLSNLSPNEPGLLSYCKNAILSSEIGVIGDFKYECTEAGERPVGRARIS